jgi:hypothetical protein
MWTPENRPKYNRDHLTYPSDLTDDEWAYVAPLIPPPRPGGGKRRIDMPAVMEHVDTGQLLQDIIQCEELHMACDHHSLDMYDTMRTRLAGVSL